MMRRTGLPPLALAATILWVMVAAPGVKARQAPGLLFDPQHQRPLSYRDQWLTISLFANGQKLALDIRKAGSEAGKVVPLPDEMVQANEMRRAQANKIVVIGMFSGDVWAVAIVDLSGPSISDKFVCYEPSVSPDGKYISFIKFFPPHYADDPEDHYMLYNLTESPAYNRPKGVGMAEWRTVGFTIYPVGVGNHEFDNLRHPGAAAHMLASAGFFWNDSSTEVVFADSFEGRVSVIRSEIHEGVATTSAASLPSDLCEGKARMRFSCALRVVSVNYSREPGQRLDLGVKGSGLDIGLNREVALNFGQFTVLGATKL